MKKVLHVITRLDTGGSAENVLLSARLADKRRFCVIVAAGSGNNTATAPDESGNYTATAPDKSGNYTATAPDKSGNNTATAPDKSGNNTATAPDKSGNYYSSGVVHVIPHLTREIRPIQDTLAFFEIIRLIKKIKPDIVHTHSSKGGILGRWAAWICRAPVIVHTPHGHVFYGYFGLVKTKMFVWLERLTAKITHRLVALTNGEMKESLAYGIGKPEQWVAIHSGVDLKDRVQSSEFRVQKSKYSNQNKKENSQNTENNTQTNKKIALRQELRIPNESIVVGTVARLEPVKGVDVFIKAAGKIIRSLENNDNVRFLIVGGGNLRSELEGLAQTLEIKDKIIFTGERTDIAGLLGAMDIYVQPSLNEGMGKCIIMAQACGLPVVASRVCGIPDVVKDGETGLLVTPGDPESLANAMVRLLEDKKLCLKLGQAGQTWVNERVDGYGRFSVERMVYLLERLYEEMCNV